MNILLTVQNNSSTHQNEFYNVHDAYSYLLDNKNKLINYYIKNKIDTFIPANCIEIDIQLERVLKRLALNQCSGYLLNRETLPNGTTIRKVLYQNNVTIEVFNRKNIEWTTIKSFSNSDEASHYMECYKFISYLNVQHIHLNDSLILMKQKLNEYLSGRSDQLIKAIQLNDSKVLKFDYFIQNNEYRLFIKSINHNISLDTNISLKLKYKSKKDSILTDLNMLLLCD